MKLFVLITLLCSLAEAGRSAPPVNIALHKPYTLSPAPNYRLCTDADDLKQLTDGTYTKGYFWTRKSTVGWSKSTPAVVTIDLGKVEPISGISWSCAAGVAGVTWPECLYVLVSNDRKNWTSLGDLCVTEPGDPRPPEKGYAQFRYTRETLKGCGRYVCVVAAAENFCFVDEIEIRRGDDAWIKESNQGEKTTDPLLFYAKHCVRSGVSARLRADMDTILSQAEALMEATAITGIKAVRVGWGLP